MLFPLPRAFKIHSISLAGLGRHWPSTATGYNNRGWPALGLDHLQGLHTMGTPRARAVPGTLPRGPALLRTTEVIVGRTWIGVIYGAHCRNNGLGSHYCNNYLGFHCFAWYYSCFLFRSLPCWRHRLLCVVKNTFGTLVPIGLLQEYTFPISLHLCPWTDCYLYYTNSQDQSFNLQLTLLKNAPLWANELSHTSVHVFK
jgi:hypothetical protein